MKRGTNEIKKLEREKKNINQPLIGILRKMSPSQHIYLPSGRQAIFKALNKC